MIISSGTTDFETTGTQLDDFLSIEKSSSTTSGGNIRSSVAGKRFVAEEKMRLSESEFSTLTSLLTDGSTYYYYTPTRTPGYLSSSDFPMTINVKSIKKTRQAWGGERKFYITILFESVGYL